MNIEHVTIYAPNYEVTKQFYETTLNFPLTLEEPSRFTIKVGHTKLTFVRAPIEERPFYHFAFDIPSNQFDEAKEWIKGKVTLNQEQGEDEVYFANIDAKSIYFEDPAGNIVEYICRFSDAEQSGEPFNTSSLQKMSEISIVVTDKLKAIQVLHEVSIFERDREEVSANDLSFMGERKDATYLLLVNEGRTWFFSNKKSIAFPVEITLSDGISVKVNEQLELVRSVNRL